MKRKLFDEMKEGFNALQSAREGKITLRPHVVEKKPAPSITPEKLMSIREKLYMSRTVPGTELGSYSEIRFELMSRQPEHVLR